MITSREIFEIESESKPETREPEWNLYPTSNAVVQDSTSENNLLHECAAK